MAPIGKLYTYEHNPRAFKALIAAKYNNVEIELPAFQFGVTNKEASFLQKFPFGKVPAFETAHGDCIFESNAIAHYVAKHNKQTTLFGDGSATQEALIQTYINVAENEIAPAAATWIYPILGFIPYSEANTKKAKEDITKTLTTLNKILATRTYLVGEAVTLADIHVAVALLFLYKLVLDPAARAPFVNVNRYFLTLVNQPEFKQVIGEVHLAEKAAVYDPKNIPKATEKPKAEKKAAEKPAEKPAPAPAPAAPKNDEEEAEETFEEPKGKNPLDNLPPSKFSLETWKRFYSNNDEEVAVKYFWDNIDLEGFSIWYCKYGYNKENTKIFMTCNLVNGFFQRCEEVRKYGFASFIIFGEDNNNEVHGYWVFRGQDIPQEVRDCPDFESYEFTKVTDFSEERKKDINAFLAWKEVDGLAKFSTTPLPFNQGKNFK